MRANADHNIYVKKNSSGERMFSFPIPVDQLYPDGNKMQVATTE